MRNALAYSLIGSLFLVAAAGCRGEPSNNDPDMAPLPDLTMPGPDMAVDPGDMAPFVCNQTPSATPTEFMVVRVGDGAAALSGAAAPVFLERRMVSDGSMVGTAIALPTTATGANKRLTIAGSAFSEGGLNLSMDKRYLLLMGYDAATGTAAVAGSTSGTTNRVIGRVTAAGVVDTSTAADFFNMNAIRSATSTDGTDLWAAGASGIVYTTFGSTTAPTSLLTTNMRWLNIFRCQLYATSSANNAVGVNAIGSGMPKSTATAQLLSGFGSASSVYGLIAFDRDATPGIDRIYVADDRDVTAGGGVQRWSLNGTQWMLDGTIAMGLVVNGVRGVTGYTMGNNVVLLVTTREATPRIVKYVDDGTALNTLPPTMLATAATNTAYRGISLPSE